MENSFKWENVHPEEQGFHSKKLERLWNELKARHTTSFVTIRNDKIVFEGYAEGWDRTKRHYTASLAKGIVGGLSLALALDARLLRLDDLACEYIPQWKNDPQKSRITIRHLATHSSGIEDANLSEEERAKVKIQAKTLQEPNMPIAILGWRCWPMP